MAQNRRNGSTQRGGAAISEPRWVRALLISVALFLGIFLLLPLIVVFTEAFKKGLEVYIESIREPDAAAAIQLTLMAAAIAVPLNLAFGIAAAWAIAKFDFPGKSFLITLIDLPFSVSPVISGLVFCVVVRASRLAWAVARRAGYQDCLRRAGNRACDYFCDFSFLSLGS